MGGTLREGSKATLTLDVEVLLVVGDRYAEVKFKDVDGDTAYVDYVPLEALELVEEPVKPFEEGDVIGRTPLFENRDALVERQPPVGSIVRYDHDDRAVVVRESDGKWKFLPDGPSFDFRYLLHTDLTVIHVPPVREVGE